MVTVLRAHGLRVVIYVDDHRPAHVHVVGDGEANINLIGADGAPELVRAYGMTRSEIRRSLELVIEWQRLSWSDGRKFMAEISDAQIDAALERGRLAQASEPRAASVRYDGKLGRIIVELTNDCTFAFPRRVLQGLEVATDEQIAEVEVLGSGFGLHWGTLDIDVSIPGLLAGIFGTRAYMARRAGQVTSPAKAAAARANGAKGGRPRQTAST